MIQCILEAILYIDIADGNEVEPSVFLMLIRLNIDQFSFSIFWRPKIINEDWKINAFGFCVLMFSGCHGAAGVAYPTQGWAGTQGDSKAGRAGTSGTQTRGAERDQGRLLESGAVWWPPGKSAVTWQVPPRRDMRPGTGSVTQARPGQEPEPNRNSRPATRDTSHRSFSQLSCFPAAWAQVTAAP